MNRNDLLHHEDFDFFQCGSCNYLWHVPKDADWPPGRSALTNRDSEKTDDEK
jgi:hypothetical protein